MILAGITFSQFLALFGALATVTILIFLLLHRRRGKEISSILIWKRVTGSRRTFFHDLLSLLLQLLFLLLVTFALTDPQILPEKQKSRHMVVVVDSSASMGAAFGETTRLTEAKRRALEILSGLGDADKAMVISAGSEMLPLTTFTKNIHELRSALDTVVPRGGDQRLAEGVQYAVSALGFAEGDTETVSRRVVVLTDRDHEFAAAGEDTDISVEKAIIADPQQNLGITAFDVRKTFNLTPGHEVLVRVANFGYSAATANLELATSQYVVGRVSLSVESRQEVQRVYYLPFGVSGRLRARLSNVSFEQGADGLLMDNACYAYLPERPKMNVCLVSAEGKFLEKAFAASPQVRMKRINPSAYSERRTASCDLVVMDGVDAPAPRRAHVFYINPGQKTSPFKTTKVVEKPVFTGWEADHPLLRYAVLKNLNLPEARALQKEKGDADLISSIDGSLLLLRKQGGRYLLGLGFDLEQSDLTLRVAFPILIHNLVTWLSEEDLPEMKLLYRVGEETEVPVASVKESSLEVSTPTGDEREYLVQEGAFRFQPFEAGYHSFEDGDAERLLPVSFILPEESDLLAGVGQAKDASAMASVDAPEPGKSYRSWLILAAILILIFDWILFHYGRIA